jgi:Domain of unknown function (DUF4258)
VRFSHHARQQMSRRRISADEVSAAVAHPETSYAGRPEGRVVVLGRTTAGRRLKVVLAGDVVVTVADRDEEA